MKATQIPCMVALLHGPPVDLEAAILDWSFEVEEVWRTAPQKPQTCAGHFWVPGRGGVAADEWSLACEFASMELVDALVSKVARSGGYVTLDRETITQTLHKIEADLVAGVLP